MVIRDFSVVFLFWMTLEILETTRLGEWRLRVKIENKNKTYLFK